MRRRWKVLFSLIFLCEVVWFAWGWWGHRVIDSSGGLYFVRRVELPVPRYRQNDQSWGHDLLGKTKSTLGQEGCAVSSAAMVLSFYGIHADPKQLNDFLTKNDGYTPGGWIYWEKAADFVPNRIRHAYEDLPSYFLIDWNLLHDNPVIIRLRSSHNSTHFVVIVGKEGWNYLIADPGTGFSKGVYPLRELTRQIDALRFYKAR